MSRNLSSLFTTETQQDQQHQLLHLLVLEVAGTILRFVDSNESVTFKGQTYSPFAFQYGSAEMTADNTISKATLVVANPTRVFMPYMEQYNGLRGYRVEIITGYDHLLSTTSYPGNNYLSEDYLIDAFQLTDATITFSLEPVINFDINLPRRRFITDSCGWRYKDPKTCKYGVETNNCSCTATQGSLVLAGVPSTLVVQSIIVGSRVLVETPTVKLDTYVIRVDSSVSPAVLTLRDPWVGPSSTAYITLALCDKTLSGPNGCRTHGNAMRYGGFPGVPSSSRRFFV